MVSDQLKTGRVESQMTHKNCYEEAINLSLLLSCATPTFSFVGFIWVCILEISHFEL